MPQQEAELKWVVGTLGRPQRILVAPPETVTVFWECLMGPAVSSAVQVGALAWDTSPSQARSPHPLLPNPPMTLTLPDHPPESLQPGGAWKLLVPGSPAQVGAPHQDLSGPCSASGHPQPGHTAAFSHTSPHSTLTFSPIPASPLPPHIPASPTTPCLTPFPVSPPSPAWLSRPRSPHRFSWLHHWDLCRVATLQGCPCLTRYLLGPLSAPRNRLLDATLLGLSVEKRGLSC